MFTFDLKHQRDTLWQSLCQSLNLPQPQVDEVRATLQTLAGVDRFWTFPGSGVMLRLQTYMQANQLSQMRQLVENCCHELQSGCYRQQSFSPFQTHLERLDRPMFHQHRQQETAPVAPLKPYFEVLIVHPYPADYELLYRQQLASFKSPHDEFIYDIVLVDCAEDALTAVLANTDIQACVYLNHVPASSAGASALYASYSQPLLATVSPVQWQDEVEVNLCRSVRAMRAELNHFLISELSPLEMTDIQRAQFDRVLFHVNPFQDLHTAILNGVRQRFSTPFFDALQAYSRQPKSVFHALPLSRGASVKESPWIHDMLDFYGNNIFLAETSSTQGGLDSLLDPTGAILQAHRKAAETFGADSSYFVTNGTSTSNKIVMQANLHPGDLVLVSSDCHKSIPYSVMLTGAYPIFLETYPLVDYDLYGGIDLAQIKAVMLDLKAHDRLHQLKQITLTNSTFDGLIYNVEHFMMELLALKPDVIFHWDEAWFAFSHFHPLYHSRTAMSAVKKIRQRMADPAYWTFYAQWKAAFDANPQESKWQQPLYPDPALVQLRVYATQSTHKTLSAFRQASMVHVADVQFDQSHFLEAFRIHTSTSPNYQIIASLDIARRQAALEGFHRVRECIFLAMHLRQRIQGSDELAPYFSVLGDAQMIPVNFRNAEAPGTPHDLAGLSQSWGSSDFVIDPTRVTLDVSRTGLDGSSFRQLLMSRYDIQVNKTSRHTALFLINIGATQASIDYLVQVLHDMAAKFAAERQLHATLTPEPAMAMPEKRHYHPAFMPFTNGSFPACDVRSAHYQGEVPANVDFVPLSADTLAQVQGGRVWVSATFVTPYPPGYPVLVPGQLITPEILSYFAHIKVKEIHGFHFERGFKVFRDEHLAQLSNNSTTTPTL
jgi:arginine decarboxylase